MIATTQYFLPQLASRQAWDGMVRDGGHQGLPGQVEERKGIEQSAFIILLGLICNCKVPLVQF